MGIESEVRVIILKKKPRNYVLSGAENIENAALGTDRIIFKTFSSVKVFFGLSLPIRPHERRLGTIVSLE